jgi:hypothetical protein
MKNKSNKFNYQSPFSRKYFRNFFGVRSTKWHISECRNKLCTNLSNGYQERRGKRPAAAVPSGGQSDTHSSQKNITNLQYDTLRALHTRTTFCQEESQGDTTEKEKSDGTI